MLQRILIAIALVSMLATAHAKNVVLESYTGKRPADAARLLAPVLEELSKKDYETGDTIARAYETRVSTPGQQPDGLPANFAAQVDVGFRAWVGGQFGDAIKVLVPLVETAHANSGAFAQNSSLRGPLQKALIALALSQQRIGDPAAMRETFMEILRSDPNATISRATYGPDAAKEFETVRRQLQAAGTGKLTVDVADQTAVVFIDEAYVGVGSVTAQLAPGEYRIVAILNKQSSRTHRATIAANGAVSIEIDPKLDQAIVTTGFMGLTFANPVDRDAHQAKFAQQVAKSIGANAIAVVGIDEVSGRSAVVGLLVSLESGKEIRRASIPVEPDPSTSLLKSLAVFLAGGEAGPGLIVGPVGGSAPRTEEGHVTIGADGQPHDDGGETHGRWGGWRWLTGTLGIAGLATGAVLVGLDGRCSMDPPAGQQCNDLYATATPGYVALGAGAVLTGISIYLFATHESGHATTITPTQGGAVASYMGRW